MPNEYEVEGNEGLMAIDTDFSLEEEYKEVPIVPANNYFGNVTKVWYDREKNTINWQIVLDENEAVMSDGETSVNGTVHVYKNWLPNSGDENALSASGKQTKRQSKINMLTKFAEDMEINMNTPAVINEALTNHDWIGLRVVVSIGIKEYEGRTFNEVKSMRANNS